MTQFFGLGQMIPNFKLIKQDTSVYLFYAGQNRKFFDDTKQTSSLFLDLPGFQADENTFSDRDLINQSVYRARAARRYLSRPAEHPRPRPANEYPSLTPSIDGRLDRGFLADSVNTEILFSEVKSGDVIIITPRSHYDPILLGEVIGEWSTDDFLVLPEFGEFSVPFRKVKWITHSLARSDFSRPVAKRMHNRRTITKIDQNYYEDIFKLIYPRYIWGNTSKLDIFSQVYSSNDPTATGEASFLIKYAIALYAATLKGQVDDFVSLEKQQAAGKYFDPTIVDQMAQSFGSPGGYMARLIGTAAGMFVAAVLLIALSDESQGLAGVKQQAIDESRHQLMEVITDEQFSPFANSLRAGTDDELRKTYGREAKAKLGLTLEGEVPPEVRARQSHDHD